MSLGSKIGKIPNTTLNQQNSAKTVMSAIQTIMAMFGA